MSQSAWKTFYFHSASSFEKKARSAQAEMTGYSLLITESKVVGEKFCFGNVWIVLRENVILVHYLYVSDAQ